MRLRRLAAAGPIRIVQLFHCPQNYRLSPENWRFGGENGVFSGFSSHFGVFWTISEVFLTIFGDPFRKVEGRLFLWDFCRTGMIEERNLPAGKGWKVCDHSSPTIQSESVFGPGLLAVRLFP